jgi:hypothetical protein
MATCSRCNGTGYEYYEDDGRMQTDACYHCGNTGIVEDDVDFSDRLEHVATVMAWKHVKQYKEYCDSNPEGEGFTFAAAENMMSAWDYEKVLVYDYIPQFLNKLLDLEVSAQEAYIRKNEAGEAFEPIELT